MSRWKLLRDMNHALCGGNRDFIYKVNTNGTIWIADATPYQPRASPSQDPIVTKVLAYAWHGDTTNVEVKTTTLVVVVAIVVMLKTLWVQSLLLLLLSLFLLLLLLLLLL